MNDNRKNIFYRILLVCFVLFLCLYAMWPLKQKDFYDILLKMANDKDKIHEIIKISKEKEKLDKNIHPFIAIDETVKELGINLADYVNLRSAFKTQDVLRVIKSKASNAIKLGLDLNGGTEFSLSIQNYEKENINFIRNQVIDILRNRINRSGLLEPEITAEGYDRISVKIPITNEMQKNEYKKLIQMSAKLEFKLVHQDNDRLIQEYLLNPQNFHIPIGYKMMENESIKNDKHNQHIIVKIRPEMSGSGIKNANVSIDQYGRRQIDIHFNHRGTEQFANITTKNVGKRLAIILDNKLYTAPKILNPIIDGNATITGQFEHEEAQNISNALSCGNLPANINIDSTFDIAPTLGKETIKNGLISGILSLILVALIMIIYYMKSGIIANIALLMNVILIMGAMSVLNATLTLAGIAGIILTIGMAVDSNVLIYERIREEMHSNRIQNAIHKGYKGAFITIFDSNMTTLLVGLILCWIGMGTVKGFGIILSIGIISSMFTSIFVTRLLFDIYDEFINIKNLKMFKLLSTTNFDFVKNWKTSLIISIIMIVISFTAIIVKNNNILGTEFTGGAQIILNYEKYVDQNEIKKFLESKQYKCDNIAYKFSPTEGSKLEILLNNSDNNKIISNENIDSVINLLSNKYQDAKFKNASQTIVGNAVGIEFTKSAIIALITAFLGIIIYLSFRFEFRYAISAIIALLHDVIICIGVLVLVDKQLTLTVVAALLTVIGYSVNDTIIIFDRIRENIKLRKDKNYKSIVNMSINQTLSRTIITSFLTLIVVVMLFIFGGTTISGFALTMIIGIIIGTYSSILIAAPLVASWHKKAVHINN